MCRIRKGPVLLVCDHPLLTALLQTLLDRAGLASQAVGSSAVHNLVTLAPRGVVLDLVLVEVNGFALLRQLAQQLSCPLVLLTATGRVSDIYWGSNAGATTVLAYPPDPEALQAALQSGES